MQKIENHRLVVLMIIAMIFWGLSWTNAKILGQYTHATIIMFWRFFFSTISFWFIVKYFKGSFQFNINNIHYIILNSFFMVFYNYFYFKGTQIGLAGAGGVLVTTLNPILTIFFSLFFGGKILKRDYLGLIMGLFGGGIILKIWELDFNILYQSGNIFFLLASLSWVSVTIITSLSKKEINFLSYSFWSFLFSTIISLFLASDSNILSVFEFDWIFWINLMALAVLAMSFGTSIFFLASIKNGPKFSSSFIYLVPITAMGFSMIFLNEHLQFTTLIGGLMGIMSVYIINR